MNTIEKIKFRKNQILFSSIVLLLLSAMTDLAAQDTTEIKKVPDPITITGIEMVSERSKGLSGILVTISFQDTLTINGNLNMTYTFHERSYKRDIRNMYTKKLTEIKSFHPYATLFDRSGDHHIMFTLDSIFNPDTKVGFKTLGKKTKPAIIEVPPLKSLKIKVNYTEVSSTTRKGKAWDYNFFANSASDNYPDLIYTISAAYNEDSNGVFTGQFYKSHKQKNTLVASWPYFSDIVYYCEGDELSLFIMDADNVFHDTIGSISLDEIKGKEKIEDMAFGRVLKFSLEIEEN